MKMIKSLAAIVAILSSLCLERVNAGKGKSMSMKKQMMMNTKKSEKSAKMSGDGTCATSAGYSSVPSIFDQLDAAETIAVSEYVATAMNISMTDPTFSNCYSAAKIQKVELLPINKAEALAYLDEDGPMPGRYAKVNVVYAPIEIMEYKVGPLPIGESTTITPLREPGTISWNARPYFPPGCEFGVVFEYIFPISLTLQKLQNDTSGGFCFGLPEDDCKEGLDFWFTADPSSTPENRVSVIQFNLIPAALGFEETDVSGTSFSTLFYIPLTYKISQPGPDPADWTSYGYEYCGQGPYDSAEALAEAYDSGELTLCPTGITDDYDPNWSGFTRRGPLRPFSDLSPPVVVEPDGPRYITEGKKISWMDWELHADQHPRFGATLHDIRFKGKRIIYELALQETYAAYSGFSGHGEVMYLDSHYGGLGNSARTLIKGVDCPETAVYFPGSNTDRPFSSFERPDAMCVYEMVNGETAWRHTTGDDRQGIPRVFLVIRALYSVGNYDYNVAINLFPSGKIKINLDAAGFMSTSTWHADEEKFGVPVQSFQSGSLHDHLFAWKLDMDIYGTKNNFAETKFAVIPTEGPNNSGGTMKAAIKEDVAEEAGFTLSTSVPNTFLVYNPDEMNSWGRPRGYALHFEGSIYNILPKDHAWSRAASWSNYNVMVTQHKDDEPYASSEMNMYVPKSPVVDAASFMDGESTVEEDLVLWLTVGKMHWPRSEDMPVVTNFGTSLDIRPWDYFDENALFDLPRKPTDTAACTPVIGELYDYESTVL